MKYWKRVCFYCTSFLSLTCRHYSDQWIISQQPQRQRQTENVPEVILWWSLTARNVKRDFFCERRVALEIFLYFCKRCLALISCLSGVPVYVVLHEANVAVDFSLSSLSLCDIVYWEKCEVFISVFFFQKRILWYRLILPFVMTPSSNWLLKSFAFFHTLLYFMKYLGHVHEQRWVMLLTYISSSHFLSKLYF